MQFRFFACIAALLFVGSSALKLSEQAVNGTAAANSTHGANSTSSANLTVSHTNPASQVPGCKTDVKYSNIEYISLILRKNATTEPFNDHCYDLKYLDKNRALHWLDSTIDECTNNKKKDKGDLCEALKCVTDDDKDTLAESIATAAEKEADACETG